MDVLIKSLNRPYFLERCIKSILKYVENYSNIIVLDDGTPQKYLDKLSLKYPSVIVKRSEFYEIKSQMIESENIDRKKFIFPGSFWERESQQTSGDNILILEDDMFFTSSIDLDYIGKEMKRQNLLLFKLMWQQNENLIFGNIITKDKYNILVPKILSRNVNIYGMLTNDRFKILSILGKLGIWNFFYKKYVVKYYSLYSVAGCIFNKKYFSHIWKDIKNLDESIQIKKTLSYYQSNSIEVKIGLSKNEILKTSLISSATNEFKDIEFSVFKFNKFINDLWLMDKVDVMNSFPNDWSDFYVKSTLRENGWSIEEIENWAAYKRKFINIYKEVGSTI